MANEFKIDVRGDNRGILALIRADQDSLTRAQVRALNRTADELRTAAGKEIRKEYNVTLRGIRQASKIDRARAGAKFPQAVLTFRGRPINLFEFDARAVNPWNIKGRKHRSRGGGVSVKVRVGGDRKLVKGAFIATIKGGQNAGKKGVFRRVGDARSQIRFLPSLSLPVMAERKAISTVLLKFADERYQINFTHELKGY